MSSPVSPLYVSGLDFRYFPPAIPKYERKPNNFFIDEVNQKPIKHVYYRCSAKKSLLKLSPYKRIFSNDCKFNMTFTSPVDDVNVYYFYEENEILSAFFLLFHDAHREAEVFLKGWREFLLLYCCLKKNVFVWME